MKKYAYKLVIGMLVMLWLLTLIILWLEDSAVLASKSGTGSSTDPFRISL